MSQTTGRRDAVAEAHVNGITISYRVEGQGVPLVLIMGYSGTGDSWIFQKRPFRKRFRVLTFDNRGVGKTDRPDGPYTTRMMADDTVALMDHLEIDRAHVLGVSMGGMIAQEVALNYPERVLKLVLGCTFAGREAPSGYSPDVQRAMGGEEGYTDEELMNAPVGKLTSTVLSFSFNTFLFKIFIVPLARVRTRLLGMKGLYGQLQACHSHNTLDRLPGLQAPTLVIAGTRDEIIAPESSDVLANAIPNARLVKVEGGSHAFFMEHPRRFNREVLGFLTE
jgi:3-oxoadipate enol-lactonase